MDFDFPIVLNEYFALDERKVAEDIVGCLSIVSGTLLELSKYNSKISFVRYSSIWKRGDKNIQEASNLIWESGFKDSHLFLMSLEDRSIQAEVNYDCDYILNEKLVHGFGVAVENDFFCISAPDEPTSENVLHGRKRGLDDDCNIIENEESCKNISSPSEDSIKLMNEAFSSNVIKISQLWDEKETLFPSLRFLPRVENDLKSLPEACFEQIFRKLLELNWSSEDWDVTLRSKPTFRTKAKPDSRTRKKLFNLIDTDGIEKNFHYHCYFTPGEGRIHFYFDPSAGSEIVIGYIGLKVIDPLRR